jgi:cell shape-determining protein MreC
MKIKTFFKKYRVLIIIAVLAILFFGGRFGVNYGNEWLDEIKQGYKEQIKQEQNKRLTDSIANARELEALASELESQKIQQNEIDNLKRENWQLRKALSDIRNSNATKQHLDSLAEYTEY